MVAFLSRIRSRVRRGSAKPLPLAFTMDVDEQGKHVVGVYADFPTGRERLNDVQALSEYGYSVERDGRRFTPSVENIEKLLALWSLNPDERDDGNLVFEISPPVLGYLRRQPAVEEHEASKRLEIRNEPLKPTLRVDYEDETGVTVRAGYQLDTSELISPSDIRRTPDGAYSRIGNVFSPLPQPPPEVKQFLDRGTSRIALKDVPEFFTRDLLALKLATQTDLSPAAAAVRVIDDVSPPRIRLDTNTPGWLDFDVSYGAGSGSSSLRDAVAAAKRGEAYVHPAPNTFVKIDPDAVLETERLVMQLGVAPTSTGYRIPAQRIGNLQDLVARVGGGEEVSAAFQEFLDELTGLELDPSAPLPPNVEQTLTSQSFQLRPYQRQGIQWLRWLAKHGLHGLLADDMGLGKTAQVILAIRADYIDHPQDPPRVLVVCPNSVVRNWEREIRRFFPEVVVDLHLGSSRQMADFLHDHPRFFISSYATLTRDVDHLGAVSFRYLVLDEASHIKNPSARRTRAMKRINAIHRVCMTGTPIENRPAELWSLMDFLLPGHLGEHGPFVRQFEEPIMAGDSEAAARLARRISPFLLRRLKEDVAKDLPEKVDLKAWCSLTKEQADLYRRVLAGAAPDIDALRRGERVSSTHIFSILTKLQQVCDHPAIFGGSASSLDGRSEKFDLVLERIEEVAGLGEKVIVFSHFLRMLDLLGTALETRRIRFVRIDGSMPADHRQQMVDRMTNDTDLTVALCSLQATGYGTNLQAANHVIHADRWWNPALEDQATARAHRIGQTKTVFVHHTLVKGTLEERIDALLEKKRGIADDVIGGASTWQGQLTRDELLQILRPLDVDPDSSN